MATDITIMTIPRTTFAFSSPTTSDARPAAVMGYPQFLLQRKGLWYNMGPTAFDDTRLLTDLKTRTTERLVSLMDQLQRGQADGDVDGLIFQAEEDGHELYRDLIPEALREEIETVAAKSKPASPPVMRIYTTFDWIPWELLHDGNTGFLGVQFQVARLPEVKVEYRAKDRKSRPIQSVHNLLGRDVLKDADLDAWEQTFAALLDEPDIERRIPRRNVAPIVYPKRSDVYDALSSDLLHVTCHGNVEDGDQFVWTLDHASAATATYNISATGIEMKMRPAESVPALVFGNACSSATQGILDGYGSRIFGTGALAFVGTFAPVSQTVAVRFAARFYQYLLRDGQPVGRALWQTRRDYHDEEVKDPSWLFYCLYGPPESRFSLAKADANDASAIARAGARNGHNGHR